MEAMSTTKGRTHSTESKESTEKHLSWWNHRTAVDGNQFPIPRTQVFIVLLEHQY
jgi:hypothetical protein